MVDNSPEKHTRLSVQKKKLEREKMLSEMSTKEASEQKSLNDSMFGFQDKEDEKFQNLTPEKLLLASQENSIFKPKKSVNPNKENHEPTFGKTQSEILKWIVQSDDPDIISKFKDTRSANSNQNDSIIRLD